RADFSDGGVLGDGRPSTGYLWPQNASVGSACVDPAALRSFNAVAGNTGADCPPAIALTPEAGVSQPPKTSDKAGGEGALIERGIHRRLEQDVRGLQDMVGRSSIEVAARTEISKRLDKLAGQATNVGWSPENAFEGTLPMHGLHQEILRTQAAYWHALGIRPFDAWIPPSPYDPVPYLS